MSYSNLKLFSLSSNHELAQKVAKEIGIELGKVSVGAHSDGETVVHIDESVRGDHVFILQSTSDPVNDNLMELLIMMDALRRASAASINIVLPYYGYARQDRKARAREPITSKLVANMLQIAGADRLITFDLHAPQIQGFFNIPVDHLMGSPLIAEYFRRQLVSAGDDIVVVSAQPPDKAVRIIAGSHEELEFLFRLGFQIGHPFNMNIGLLLQFLPELSVSWISPVRG